MSSAWTLDRGRFRLRVGVPAGATAEILVPARDRKAVKAAPGATFHGMRDGYAVFRVGSGDHVFHSAK